MAVSKDGLRSYCRGCASEWARRYQKTLGGQAAIRKAYLRWQQSPKGRAKIAEGRARVAEAVRRYRQTPEGRAKHAEYLRRWRQNPKVRAKRAERMRRRFKIDPQFRLASLLRARLHSALKGTRKSARTLELLGCPIEHLAKHLESKFLPGMSWQNHGEWHVDHIRPLASFDLSDPAQQREACNWTNLQPLWAADNIRKGDKLIS